MSNYLNYYLRSNIRHKSVLNFILCLPELIFYDAYYTGSESHTAEFIYDKLKSVIEEVGSSKFVAVITDNANTMRAAWRLLDRDYSNLICMRSEAILQQESNTIMLVKPVDTRWGTYLNSVQSVIHSIEELNLNLQHEEDISNLITTRFEFIFHPALVFANLLDPNFHGKALKPDDLTNIVIPYLNENYSSTTAAHLYGTIQKYIAKSDEFSNPLLWESIKYSNSISWWKSNFEHKYPLLVKLAVTLLSIPTLSASAERNWSQFRFIHSKLRTRLDNNKVKKLVAISQNLRIQKNIVEDSWFDELQ
ncbi:10286_t:CDS:2 [Scutellospora calospora]|uniref:10286_t:CDS:1 n=1 Tax=Scutellospora calospora TaxID=85575 RepID=A0ACA9JUI4_9GLOM|nr:10286_t:CDS:2 [Scutellospora calospora]